MSEHRPSSQLEIATHAALPPLLMLFIQMTLNHFAAPQNAIFISPYLLAFFVTTVLSLIVLWKGQICPGQRGRLTFVLLFLWLFALGNLVYVVGFTPKHSPALIAISASLILPLILWKLPDDEPFKNIIIYCGFGIVGIGVFQYLLIYWYELPSLFNGVRANNFAQILLGILLTGWYLMLAKSRLDGFFKLLIQLALIALVLSYIWTAFVLYQHLQIMPEMPIRSFVAFFAVQFLIFVLLAWLLLGNNIKSPTAWSLVTLLAMLYPLANAL